MKYLYCFIFLLCGISAFGQGRGAFPQEIDNANAKFPVQVEVDRPNRVYADGDIMQVTVTSRQDGFLYLFYRDANANVTVLFPNQFQQNNRIQGGVPFVSGPKVGFQIRIGAPFGHELLTAVVTKKELTFINQMGTVKSFTKFVISSVDSNTRYAPVDDNVGNALLETLDSAEEADWAADKINIRTVARREDFRPPSNGTAKMHLLLAADVSANDAVGKVVQSDAYNLRELLENSVTDGRLNTIDLQKKRRGELLTREDILREIHNVNVNPNDTIFFFYSGHGAYDEEVARNDKNGGQYFALASCQNGEKPIFRYEVLDALKSKNARLSILISDCCFNEMKIPTHLRPAQPLQPRGELKGLKPLVETLFFEARGVVNITASEKDTYGFIYPDEVRVENGINKGSIFTWNLCKILTTEMYASRDWKQIFELVREETNEDYQKVFRQHIAGGRVKQKEQIPDAFDLP